MGNMTRPQATRSGGLPLFCRMHRHIAREVADSWEEAQEMMKSYGDIMIFCSSIDTRNI